MLQKPTAQFALHPRGRSARDAPLRRQIHSRNVQGRAHLGFHNAPVWIQQARILRRGQAKRNFEVIRINQFGQPFIRGHQAALNNSLSHSACPRTVHAKRCHQGAAAPRQRNLHTRSAGCQIDQREPQPAPMPGAAKAPPDAPRMQPILLFRMRP